ncbi:DUF294 nucleotidyltransferase-like domain-containing protein [Hydrogenimonas sp.]
MSIVDQRAYVAAMHPFDTLDEGALQRVLEALEIAYYPAGSTLCQKPDRLHMIIKGVVACREPDGHRILYGPHESFCAAEILGRREGCDYEVEEELLCYELPAERFLELVERHEAFRRYYLEDIAARIQSLRERANAEGMAEFLGARVREIFIHPPYFAPCGDTIRDAVAGMEAAKASAILLQKGGELGIVTDTDLRHHVIAGGLSSDEPIEKIATWGVYTIEADDFLFNALLLMTRHGVKRLVVTRNGEVAGLIEQIDLLSYFSHHAYLLTTQIERARSVEELESIGDGLLRIVRSLHTKGVKARYIARIVSELNDKLFARLFTLTFPAEWHVHMALMVMGSEGRREQIVRTDQDNGLVLADGFDPPGLQERALAFSRALERLGFPRCPGGVMVENPLWRQSVDAYRQAIEGWVETPEGEAAMNLAILADARCVAGDDALVAKVRRHLFETIADHPTALGLFAQSVERFEIPLGWFGRLESGRIDIKKGGIFILMHGIRALAVDKKIEPTATVERIKALSDGGLFDKGFATELIESFDVLLTIQLGHKLGAIERGEEPDNAIDVAKLSKLERDMLREALGSVKSLKRFVAYHFRLDMVG